MRIGFLLPANFGIGNPGNGVLMQARCQAEALRRADHEVVELNPWDPAAAQELDIVQFFQGGYAHYMIHAAVGLGDARLVFAPIIDSNVSMRRYRLAARLGQLTSRLSTVPGVFAQQAATADLIICRSQHEIQRLRDGLGADPAKLRLVPNGVDPPIGSDAARARKNFDLPERFILHVSAYTQARKNVARLIEAVAPLGYPLVIAGHAPDGPDKARIHALAQRHGNVRFLGFIQRAELNDLYAACDVFALPSTHEGTGLAALEAAACGARIVITQHGGPPDYFLDMAQYVDPSNVQTIRGAVRAAWETEADDRLARHVIEHLTWDASVAALVDAYASVL